MIFWITLFVMIASIMLTIYADKRFIEWLNNTGLIITFISIAAVIVMFIGILGTHIAAKPFIAENQEKYNTLIYKLESENCRDEFGLLNKEIIDEIQNWNEDLAYYKSAQKDFWIGIFFPNIFDQFEFIDYRTK